MLYCDNAGKYFTDKKVIQTPSVREFIEIFYYRYLCTLLYTARFVFGGTFFFKLSFLVFCENKLVKNCFHQQANIRIVV